MPSRSAARPGPRATSSCTSTRRPTTTSLPRSRSPASRPTPRATTAAPGVETGEPGANDASVWYSWTAPAGAGLTRIDTCSSGFDTVLGVYTGAAVGSLTQVTAPVDDTAGCGVGGTRSRVTFTATQGTAYRIVVWGKGTGASTAQGTVALRLDGAPPETNLTVLAQDPTNDNTPTFTFMSEAGATFECAVDTPTFTACSSPFTLSQLSDGSHTFQVRAVDSSGNTDPTPATDSFGVDTVAPPISLDSQPPALSNNTSPSVTFSSVDPTATFECSIDGTLPASFAPCTSPKSFPAVADGGHTIRVRAKDPAGNLSTAVATNQFTVDTAAPGVTLLSTPATFTSDTTPTVTFSSTDPTATFECSVDSTTSYESCTSGFTPTVAGQGSHTIRVRATDGAANTTASPAQTTFTTDTVAPTTSITSQPEDPSNLTFGEFSYTQGDANPGTFECRVDNAPAGFTACSSPEAQNVGNGSHTFEVRARDLAGNVDQTPATFTWTVDIDEPETTVTTPATGAFVNTRARPRRSRPTRAVPSCSARWTRS